MAKYLDESEYLLNIENMPTNAAVSSKKTTAEESRSLPDDTIHGVSAPLETNRDSQSNSSTPQGQLGCTPRAAKPTGTLNRSEDIQLMHNPTTNGRVKYVRLVSSDGRQPFSAGFGSMPCMTVSGDLPVAVTQAIRPESNGQRIILPADLASMRQSSSSQWSQVNNLMPLNTSLLSSTYNIPESTGIRQKYAFLPAHSARNASMHEDTSAVTSTHYGSNGQLLTTSQPPAPPAKPATQQKSSSSSHESNVKLKKPCNCNKSQCLKLYCDCFANGEFCSNCNCQNCFNNLDHEEERQRAIKQCLERNPSAFHPKIGKGSKAESRRHRKGCNCKRSGCLKNYCECYEAKIPCGTMCKCVGCKNFAENNSNKSMSKISTEPSIGRRSQSATLIKAEPQTDGLPQSTVAPYNYLKKGVVKAVMDCLLTQCIEAEAARCKDSTTEKVVLEEFGRCLNELITASNMNGQTANSGC